MHQCEEFRERITEKIVDQEEIDGELLICSECAEFYAEAKEMLEALSAVDQSVSDEQWSAVEHRLRMRLVAEARPRLNHKGIKTLRFIPAFAAAAMLLITIGISQLPRPVLAPQAVYDEQMVPLDPVTVDFLEESELLLRNVMKMTPADVDDLAEAREQASDQLVDIEQRKEAAADVPPVVNVMNTYESILRDLRHLDERSTADDIADIQSRIQKNGLIANIKAFQPSLTPASFAGR